MSLWWEKAENVLVTGTLLRKMSEGALKNGGYLKERGFGS
jgi:hypothetical protein